MALAHHRWPIAAAAGQILPRVFPPFQQSDARTIFPPSSRTSETLVPPMAALLSSQDPPSPDTQICGSHFPSISRRSAWLSSVGTLPPPIVSLVQLPGQCSSATPHRPGLQDHHRNQGIPRLAYQFETILRALYQRTTRPCISSDLQARSSHNSSARTASFRGHATSHGNWLELSADALRR